MKGKKALKSPKAVGRVTEYHNQAVVRLLYEPSNICYASAAFLVFQSVLNIGPPDIALTVMKSLRMKLDYPEKVMTEDIYTFSFDYFVAETQYSTQGIHFFMRSQNRLQTHTYTHKGSDFTNKFTRLPSTFFVCSDRKLVSVLSQPLYLQSLSSASSPSVFFWAH